MMVNNDIISLEAINPERFSRVISLLSIEDPTSYDVVIEVITKAKNLSGAAKTNYGKSSLLLDDDLLDAITSFVNFVPEVADE